MKKVLLLTLGLALAVICNSETVKAGSDYTAFQEIYFEEEGYKFIKEYTDEELEEARENVNKRKFAGWNIYDMVDEKRVIYVDETVFTCRNEGKTPVTYKLSFKEEEIEKRSFSVTGSIDLEMKGTIKKLKSGLDTKLKIDYSESSTTTKRSEWYAKLDIDSGTELVVDIVGEGYIRNGVAAKYAFWFRIIEGEYEMFTISTQYYRMEKLAYDA